VLDLDPTVVQHAVAGLANHAAVGMPALHFADNSVVCHARRLAGYSQDVFVSGSALAIDIPRVNAFFPEVYNEDWLFLAPYLNRRQVAAFGEVGQRRYDPYEYPHRAGSQEFGDLLAEGLIGYLHGASRDKLPPIDYWQAFIEQRALFIAEAAMGCLNAERSHARAIPALAALEVAEQTRSKISAAIVHEYLAAWLSDLALWRRFIVGLPRVGTLCAATRHLDLLAVTVTSETRHRWSPVGQRFRQASNPDDTARSKHDAQALGYWIRDQHRGG
jgi:hypothetical protein